VFIANFWSQQLHKPAINIATDAAIIDYSISFFFSLFFLIMTIDGFLAKIASLTRLTHPQQMHSN